MSAETTPDIKFTDLGLPETLLQALRGQTYARSRSWDAMVDEMSTDLAI